VGTTSTEQSGLPANRVEALCDGVFAIAMTVLVLNIQVPEGGDDLGTRLIMIWPKLASYATSFVMLAVLWIGHHFQFNYIRRADRPLLWINILFLLAITFLPFTTAVLANYYKQRLSVFLYGSNLLFSGFCLLGHWVYATANHRLVPRELDDSVIASVRTRITIGLGVYGLAIVLGFLDTRASLGVFVAMPLMYLIPSRVDRHVAGKD
jgi:uncharacterized membrane protein